MDPHGERFIRRATVPPAGLLLRVAALSSNTSYEKLACRV
jgi:hypothetical protein